MLGVDLQNCASYRGREHIFRKNKKNEEKYAKNIKNLKKNNNNWKAHCKANEHKRKFKRMTQTEIAKRPPVVQIHILIRFFEGDLGGQKADGTNTRAKMTKKMISATRN